MSAENERGDPPGKKSENGGHLGRSPSTMFREHWPMGLKFIELVFAVFCLGLVTDPINHGRLTQTNFHHVGIIYTAFGGYIIVNAVMMIGGLFGERPGWKISMAFSLVGAVVFTAAGAVIISDWTVFMYNHLYPPSKHYMDMFISSGVFAIFSAAIYILDAIFTYREEP